MTKLLLAVGLGLLVLFLFLIPLQQATAQGNQQLITVLSSASRTATVNSDDQLSGLGVKGGYFILNVTGALTTPVITPSVQIKDPVSGNYVSVAIATTGVTTNGTYTYLLYPDSTTTGFSVTQVISLPLPQNWRVRVVHYDTDPITYSVGAMLLQ